MRRDRRLRQAEVRREFTDPVRPVGKAVDERQPGRLGQCPENTGYILVLVQIIIHRHIPFISLSDDDSEVGAASLFRCGSGLIGYLPQQSIFELLS